MAKLALLFIAVFCIFQIALAARIARDTTPDSSNNDIAKQMKNAWESFTKQLEEVLDKDNLNKLADDLKEIGEKIKTAGGDLVSKIEEKSKTR